MSRSFRSFDFDDEMMQHMFDMDAGYKGASTNTARRNRIKRMEELSHSLDDGLNYLGDEYGQAGGGGNGGQSGSRGGARDNTQYNDEEDEDDDDYDNDDYIDDYYYNNNKSFDGRPKSYNEKYSYMYNDYDGPNGRPKQENYRYSLNDPPVGKNLRYQQQSTSQQQQQQQQQQQKQFHSQPSTLRHKNSQGSSGNGTHGSSKHILFNDEDDICYVMDKKQSKSQQLHQQQQQQQQSPPPPIKSKEKEKKKKEPLSPSSLFSSKKKPSKEELRYDVGKSDKSQQVMKAKLKIQNMSNDDSILNMRSNQKQNLLHRHHSVEAKLPSHGADRSQMSPTILEEIEFEMQDVDCEKDDQMEEPIKEKEKSKEKASSKDKDKDKKGSSDSAPSTPTIKKSFRSHLPNHKKLFKVPDIDLNHLKFSCFFSSNKNIALNSSKSATASNTIANKTVSTEAITSKSSENLIEETTPTKVPDSPRKTVKIDLKNEKLERNDSQLSRETYKTHTRTNSGSRTMGSVNNIQSSNENVVDDASVHSSNISDKDFEVNVCVGLN